MIHKAIALLVAGALCAAPAAAQDSANLAGFERGPAAFAGMTVKLPLGGKTSAKPQARLQLTTYRAGAAQSGGLRRLGPAGLELGFAKSGKPLLFAGGRDTRTATAKMGVGTTTWLIIGGVVVALVVVAAAASSSAGDTCPEYEGSKDHCINP